MGSGLKPCQFTATISLDSLVLVSNRTADLVAGLPTLWDMGHKVGVGRNWPAASCTTPAIRDRPKGAQITQLEEEY